MNKSQINALVLTLHNLRMRYKLGLEDTVDLFLDVLEATGHDPALVLEVIDSDLNRTEREKTRNLLENPPRVVDCLG